MLAGTARGEDWAAPIVAGQRALAERGVNLGAGITGFGQGLMSSTGRPGMAWGGKLDVRLGLDGARLGLWEGLSVSLHLEEAFGRDANQRGDGSVIPVNTGLALPRLGGTTTDLSLTVTQRFGERMSLTVGKFNMLDAAAATPLLGGGGLTTFWNTGLAAPVSGVTPPYIFGGLLALRTEAASFSLLVYDPRSAQNLDVIRRPFDDAATFSLSATVPFDLFGLPGFHSVRVVYSTQQGLDLADIPQLLLPPGSGQAVGSKRGYLFGSYSFQQYLYQVPGDPRRGWGVFGMVGLSDGNPNPIRASALLGIGGDALLPSRPQDRWGIAAFYYNWSGTLRDGLAAAGQGLRDEWGVEAFYDIAIADHVRLSPNLQAVRGATPGLPMAVLGGVRVRLTF